MRKLMLGKEERAGGTSSLPVELLGALVAIGVDHQAVSQDGCQSSELCCLLLQRTLKNTHCCGLSGVY